MVGIPDRFAAPDLPVCQGTLARSTSHLAYPGELSDAVQAARRADAFVTFENSLTEMAGIRTEPPFFHAPVGAERPPARWDFKVAPPADASSVVSLRD